MIENRIPLNACFKSAQSIFSDPPKPMATIKDACIVAVDANVLLAPYALSDEPLNQIINAYEQLSNVNRLVIPGQAAREFARHRNSKIGELLKTVQDQMSRQSSPMATKYAFLRNLPEYEKALSIAKDIESKQKELLGSLKEVAAAVRGWNSTDPVWEAYRKAMKSSVVELDSATEETLAKEMKYRVEHSIPPGFKDANKPDGGVGDLAIWKTILKVGKERKVDFVFVTLDQKADWWTQSAGSALFPRYELIEEYKNETGGFSLHLLRFSEFLSQFGATPETVKEVREVEDAASISLHSANIEDNEHFSQYSPLDIYIRLAKKRNTFNKKLADELRETQAALKVNDFIRFEESIGTSKKIEEDLRAIREHMNGLITRHPSILKYEKFDGMRDFDTES